MKKIILSLILVVNLFAYQKGDFISEAMATHLGMQEGKIYIVDFLLRGVVLVRKRYLFSQW